MGVNPNSPNRSNGVDVGTLVKAKTASPVVLPTRPGLPHTLLRGVHRGVVGWPTRARRQRAACAYAEKVKFARVLMTCYHPIDRESMKKR